MSLLLFLISFGYLLGSIPFGLVLCRLAGYGDIRAIGSGNIGATNVLRTGNKALAALTLLLDISKGFIAVLAAGFLTDNHTFMALAGFTAIIGHNFPVWLSFKGGKGVATSIGTIVAIHPPVGFSMIIGWLITAFLFRISSLSALFAFIIAPLVAAYLLPASLVYIIYCICLLGAIRHHQNITRLLEGIEPKINVKKNA
jgi:glycerol-3-phosphate acyltransferase PlsY